MTWTFVTFTVSHFLTASVRVVTMMSIFFLLLLLPVKITESLKEKNYSTRTLVTDCNEHNLILSLFSSLSPRRSILSQVHTQITRYSLWLSFIKRTWWLLHFQSHKRLQTLQVKIESFFPSRVEVTQVTFILYILLLLLPFFLFFVLLRSSLRSFSIDTYCNELRV